MTELLAGIDVGTSGVKAGVFDPAGRLLGLGRSAHRVESPHPGWAQTDPEHWWQGFLAALRQACEEAEVEPGAIAALGLSVLFPAVAPLDARGRALYPALLYCDQRSLPQVQQIEERIPRAEYQAITGNRLAPGTCAVTSMRWLHDEEPCAYAAAKVLGLVNTFFVLRLTGSFVTDPSNAALSGLVDIRDPWRWSDVVCEKLGIEQQRLPQISGATQVVGQVTRAAAAETGLESGTPVVVGAGDAVAAALGAGVRMDEVAVYTAGSTDCVSVVMPSPAVDSAWINCAYVPRATWLAIGPTNASGVSVEWFARSVLASDDLTLMTELASSSPAGSNRLIYLPYLQGERTPVWDPRARGLFIGLTTSTDRGDLARAVFEGTAFALRQVIACMDEVTGGKSLRIRAVGGGTRNPLWNQIKADVLQTPLYVLAFQETGVLGAALMAGKGAGVYDSFEEAAHVAARIAAARVIAPDPDRAELYDELFALYSQVYSRTKDIMHRLDGGGFEGRHA